MSELVARRVTLVLRVTGSAGLGLELCGGGAMRFGFMGGLPRLRFTGGSLKVR
jgi:hypothetical protein